MLLEGTLVFYFCEMEALFFLCVCGWGVAGGGVGCSRVCCLFLVFVFFLLFFKFIDFIIVFFIYIIL